MAFLKMENVGLINSPELSWLGSGFRVPDLTSRYIAYHSQSAPLTWAMFIPFSQIACVAVGAPSSVTQAGVPASEGREKVQGSRQIKPNSRPPLVRPRRKHRNTRWMKPSYSSDHSSEEATGLLGG